MTEKATLAGGPARYALATVAGGCFWCTEAIFRRLKGVESVESGYAGGNPPGGRKNPSYEEVGTGTTNHAESIQIAFDPEIIPYEKLLEIFFHTHNPTTVNRQGADVGSQYRSVIFYHNEKQKRIAEKVKDKVEKERTYKDPIVTSIQPFSEFYKAEEYHQKYYERNKQNSYCSVVIDPKVQKLLKDYRNDVKKEYQN